MAALYVIALGVYAVTSTLLFVFGVNLARFSFLAWRYRRRRGALDPDAVDGFRPSGGVEPPPTVTVQLPIYNELYVARRVIEAACALDYPRHRLQIQVLDDSDDETSVVAAEAVAEARARGIDIEHLRRPNRAGYKAGALAAGLARAKGSLVAIFDADFVPPADFLRRTVPHFGEENVGFVQGRWGHLNAESSWLTRLQVPAIDGHFLVEQRARGLRGYWFNFNGTAGVWRAEAIAEAGGWQHDTLTEDLDLSYRAHLAGWRGVYLPDLVVPGELPVQLSGFRAQQHRWAHGSLGCARKLLGPILRSDVAPGVKAQAALHLLAYGIHLLLVALVVSYPFVLLAARALGLGDVLHTLGYGLAPASLTPVIFLGTGQALQGRPTPRRVAAVAGIVVFGSGMMLNTARAAVQLVRGSSTAFERTAKYGLAGSRRRNEPDLPADGDDRVERGTGWASKRYQRPTDRLLFGELALGLYGLATAALAVSLRSWGIAFYASLFAVGLLAVAGASLVQTFGIRRQQRVAPDRPVTTESLSDLRPIER